ncbi:23S rRNA (pseudouridine(1915)-N(3))-methyltransferase RlmH [Teredinibacter waterburyi]|jgi:23S rRNA (pseudouridine-1915-N(3)-) methyltransferase|uniref:23S rRNA (pseudouridine(1915)-N(3))-methyltransferase RlmH n=1 Tax=Teredinibacter waterburyi TaxID=1500538 RepID=UPI00165FC22C|nr:23S rRNA (pseudouridine(1915)-N(3))-methyltransferase RlmH [Teredinibacter waterburyi]
MKIDLIAVGTKMPSWVQEGYQEYAKRLPRDLSLNLVELPLANRSKNTNVDQVKAAEGEQILSVIGSPSGNHRVIALDVLGKKLSTELLAEKMASWRMDGVNVSLLIGGPDGLSPKCLNRADEKWSLSGLTLPHPLVRIVLAEQLYRAWTILQNHPYHK